MASNASITKLRQKLERAEIEHLRTLVTQLSEQLERAEESVLFWQGHAMNLQFALDDDEFATHRCVGINKSGELMVVKNEAVS